MTVGELMDELDNYGNHLEVRFLPADRETSSNVKIEGVEYKDLPDGIVVILFA